MGIFNLTGYSAALDELFRRFPSVQQVPMGEAYKPGLDRMRSFDELLGCPAASLRCIHVAGTNGKGSVANMLASALAASGTRVGLYTSPHILDFRERMRIASPAGIPDGGVRVGMVPREWVYDFIIQYRADFERLQLSFFEITTGMAFRWFADCGVDWAVVEVGLGGRLDSTNIITPVLSVVTSIGLDHCDLLGHSLGEIAAEKAGIFKKGVPALVGARHPETEPVFRRVAASAGAPLFFADDAVLPGAFDAWVRAMDLQGAGQRENLRTVLRAWQLLREGGWVGEIDPEALLHTAARMDFHGRWERLCERPTVICDIGHNAAALAGNFRALAALSQGAPSGEKRALVIVYAVMADKDLDAILPLMPLDATFVFTTPATRRALPAARILERWQTYRAGLGYPVPEAMVIDSVEAAVKKALEIASEQDIIYIGGSTFAVAEAVPLFGADPFFNNR